MLSIRLTRMGRRHHPFYRIVVADSRKPRDGRFIEILGHYDPLKKPEELTIDQDKYKQWIDKGAKPSDTVKTLVKRQGE
jgi:small subunit ribosomal protein S16